MANANPRTQRTQDAFYLAVKTELVRRQSTVTSLARQLGLARNTVSMAINHATILPTVRRKIARHLKLSF